MAKVLFNIKQEDERLVRGIRDQDGKVLQEIYRDFFPLLRAWISRNQGNEEAARDIFQEAMVVIFEKVQDESFRLTHSFRAYLLGVGKNLWLMQLRRRPHAELPEEDPGSPDLSTTIADDLQRHARFELYRDYFNRLGDNCQQVLSWFLNGKTLREIATQLDTTEKYAKKRKYLCQKQLIEAIQTDSRFRELSQ